jgi:hypothetical protein
LWPSSRAVNALQCLFPGSPKCRANRSLAVNTPRTRPIRRCRATHLTLTRPILVDKQHDPKSESRAVEINEPLGKRGSKHSGGNVSEQNKQRDYRHAREEQIVATNSPARACCCSCHSASGGLQFGPRKALASKNQI